MKTKLLIVALFSIGLAQGQNLLQNGSFEQFTGTIPNSWTLVSGSSDTETTTFNHGAASLIALPESSLPFSAPFFWISQDFTLNSAEVYTLKFDYYIPGTMMSNYISRVGFELSLNNSAEAFFFPNYPTIPVTYGTWKTVTFDFNILLRSPATSTSLKLTLQANTDVGFSGNYMYFDNVVIAKKSTLSTVDFTKKSAPIVSISKNEIVLNSEYKNSSYVIYSIDGKSVKRGKNSSESVEISGLATGVYFLKLEDVSTSVKFVKQ
ncbi:T9SS type A sorting domain-containing protein [Flavobacterium psychroterrae]|uniref:T9SS type A sorting domain-containing protein n=1 Tax=Flavobacterium psychroterrae TaxID=2133767 RepID=A0ABS5PET9_9FLAO|nr:T9SS type A sorting domain-containing protein [Flavobacterium psychroterrae]MBS7232794.1 T9SS type A sorting domain-containing protein [Flavobacterium psychroterrae]